MKRSVSICFVSIVLLLSLSAAAQTRISHGPVLGRITSCQGVESQGQEIQFFTFLGSTLTGDVDVAASSGFLVSTSEFTGFAQEKNVVPHRGLVVDTIYVRLGPTAPVGQVSGTITLSTGGTAAQVVNVTGNVLPTPTAVSEPNITVLNGTTIPRLNFGGTGNTYLWTIDNPNIGLAASGVDSLPTFRASGNTTTPVIATVTVTPALAGAAYITEKGIDAVGVINTLLNQVDTTMFSLSNKPTSETLSPDYSELYVLNTGSLTVSTFTTAINKYKRLFYIPTTPLYPIYPYQIAINKANTEIYLANFGSDDSFIFNALTGQLIKEIIVGNFPSETAFSPSGNLYYVGSNLDVSQGNVNIFNSSNNTPAGTIRVPPFSGAYKAPPPFPYLNMAFSPDSTILYVCNGSQITEVNTVQQAAVGSVPVGSGGKGAALALAISPDGKTLYALLNQTGAYYLQAINTLNNAPLGNVFIPDTPSGLCISPDGDYIYITSSANTVVVYSTNLNKIIANIPVGSDPEINTFCVKPGGCYGEPISFTITVNPAPVPTVTIAPDSLDAMTTIYGTPSSTETFTVSGALLRSAIQLTPPAGFELSLDNINFNSSLAIDASGTLAPTTVYVRLAAADAVGDYTGYVVLVSPGAGNARVFIAKSTVTAAPLTITADNKTKAFGARNPLLTATYSGFKNGDTPANLVYQPALASTAQTDSPVGQYPITVSAAYSENYNITFVPGTLTITPDVIIPNTFTPNGDGINDTWDIQKINDYPNCTVQVFSRYGQIVFQSTGYGSPWDGAYKGSPVPVGTYYYIINLNAGVPLLSGFVAVIR